MDLLLLGHNISSSRERKQWCKFFQLSSVVRIEDSPTKHLIEIAKHMLRFHYFSVRVGIVTYPPL